MAQLYLTLKELSVSGYVRAAAETESGRGEYGCIGVYLRPYVLNIKRGRKRGAALLVPRKNYQYLAMCEHQLRLKLEGGEYGWI